MVSSYWNKGGRDQNEDSLSLQLARLRRKQAAFLAVCDGIGSLSEGETASGFVVEQMTAWFWERALPYLKKRRWEASVGRSALRRLYRLQEKIEQYERQERIRSGATCTLAVLCQNRFLILHSGDSRAYLVGKQEKQLTKDHRQGGKLCRCIGDFGFRTPDMVQGRLKRGQLLLLCTDGYCHCLPEGFLREWLGMEKYRGKQGEERLRERMELLGDFLLAHGEKDNLTAAALWRPR